ncbi:MAG: hypothetical protein Q8R60_03405 [Mycobacteriales bacterium]|nr:hypothetical protein [Mycobacteriales bacterium]
MSDYYRLHSLTQTDADAELIKRTGRLRGYPSRFSGDRPLAQAYYGPLPPGASGIEFVTSVQPDRNGDPVEANWSGWRHDVTLGHDPTRDEDYAEIPVEVTRILRKEDA